MADRIDCVVIGAGVVGLAVARELARSGREVVVVEQNAHIGEETSSRNSEVVHAGLYYPTGSLKARLCVEGKALLYRYCEDKNVGFERVGKLIVAIDEAQLERLDAIAEQARINGVADLERLDADRLREYEPDVRGVAALWSPSTGIVDAHGLMVALRGDFEAAGGMIAFESRVDEIAVSPAGIRLAIEADDETSEVEARAVVNAGGLHAGRIAARCRGIDGYEAPEIRYAKGSYFVYDGASPFRHLVYPVPVDGGLGVHATLDLGGRLRFGPDVEWIADIDYALDGDRVESFYNAIRNYWPVLERGRLAPGYTGIRPKLSGPGEPAADFRFDLASASPEATLAHLYGIESPGLTASLAIAAYVKGLIDGAA